MARLPPVAGAGACTLGETLRRRLLLAAGCAVALATPAPTTASGAELHVPNDATAPSRPFAAPLRDAVIDTPRETRRSTARAAGVRATASASQRFFSSDGQGPVRVDLSESYGEMTQAKVQPFVDFLASRVHGSELRRLTLFILTPAEIREACTETALACYLPRRELMVIPGEQTQSGEVPVEYVITHEYGHHVATNRDNDPWTEPLPDGVGAAAWGPKAWATREGICAGVADDRYFPGDQGENYARNPGENWAEAYAQLHYPNRFPWQFDRTLAPDAAAFAAITRDVTRPWRGNVAVRRSGRLTRSKRARSFRIATTLDGRVKLSLKRPRGARFELQILTGGKVRVRSRRGRTTLEATDCQARRFTVRVVRRAGSGRFTVRVQTPG